MPRSRPPTSAPFARFAGGLLLWALLAASAPARAACLLEDLSSSLEAGIHAYQDMDAGAFSSARANSSATLECLKEPITPEVALQYHLVDALDAFLVRDPDRAVLAFQAMLSIQPHYTLGPTLAPPDHPLRIQFQEARSRPASKETHVMASPEVRLRVDGREATTRPSERPAILQWIRRDGSPLWTGYLPAHTPIPGSVLAALSEERAPEPVVRAPDPPPKPVLTPPPVAVPPPVVEVRPVTPEPAFPIGRVVLLAGTGGSALATGGILLAALKTRESWEQGMTDCVLGGACQAEPEEALADLEDQARRARNLGYAFQGCAVLTAGLGTWTLLTVQW